MHQSVCVVGLGYIGLPTAVLLAGAGHRVFGYDVKKATVDTVNRGELPIIEPGLDVELQAVVTSGALTAHLTPQPADVYVLCVPTPSHEHAGVHTPDLSYVFAAARSIAPMLKKGDVVILESTSPVGTTDQLRDVLRNESVDIHAIHLAYCPERVLPGNAMVEMVHNDRIVGGLTPMATEAAVAFYRTFVKGDVLGTRARTAEMSKLAENSYRDVNIAFANELSILCANQGIDVWELIALANRHPRVNILRPGPGVGGHCIAVDPWFIVASDPDNARLIRGAREVNLHKTQWVMEAIARAIGEHLTQHRTAPVIGCYGLAFKPDIDDLRESPALGIARALQARGHVVMNVEPHVEEVEGLNLISAQRALEICDIHVVLVSHTAFKELDWRGRRNKSQPVLDFCGSLNGAAV